MSRNVQNNLKWNNNIDIQSINHHVNFVIGFRGCTPNVFILGKLEPMELCLEESLVVAK